MFCDDDDLCNVNRCCCYYNIINSQEFKEQTYDVLWCPSVLIIDGKSEEIDNECKEYFTYCVKLSVLKKFCGVMESFKLLNTPLCDIIFGNVIDNLEYLTYKIEQWQYAYNISKNTIPTYVCTIEKYKDTYTKEIFDELKKKFKLKCPDNILNAIPLTQEQIELYKK